MPDNQRSGANVTRRPGRPTKYGDDVQVEYVRLRRILGLSPGRAGETAGASRSWGVAFEKKLLREPGLLDRLLLQLEAEASGTAVRPLLSAPVIMDDFELTDDARRALDDFEFFRFAIFGRRSAPWAADCAHQLVELYDSPETVYLELQVAPGAGKSTLLTCDFAAWVTCRNRYVRGVLGHAQLERGTRYVDRLRREFDRTRPAVPTLEDEKRGAVRAMATMVQWYGRFRPEHGQLWRRDQFQIVIPDADATIQKEPTWSAASMESEIIGDRINLGIFDDATTAKRSRSDIVRNEDREHWDGVIENRIEGGGMLVDCGQRIHPMDLHRYNLDKRVELEIPDSDGETQVVRMYHQIVYRVHDDSHCLGAAGHEPDAPAWDPAGGGGCVIDPAAYSWKKLQVAKTKDPVKFELVYQQNDTAYGQALVNRLWIDGGEHPDTHELFPGCWDARALGTLPDPLPPGFVSWACVDPSGVNYWSLEWWLLDPKTNERYLIDKIRKRMKAPELLEPVHGVKGAYRGAMEDWAQRSRGAGAPISVWVVEQNGAQRYLLQYEFVRLWMRERGTRIIPHNTSANKGDEEMGVEGILPSLYRQGLCRLPGHHSTKAEVETLVSELTTYPYGGTNDEVMSQWMGEYNLQHFRKRELGLPPDRPRPSWMKPKGDPMGGLHIPGRLITTR